MAEKQDVFKDVTDKLASALQGLREAKTRLDAANKAVSEAQTKQQEAVENVNAATGAVGDLQRSLKAHVESELGIVHGG